LTTLAAAMETHPMPRARVNGGTSSAGVDLEYETIGSPEGVPLLLVMGFTAQLIAWPDAFCTALADQGHFVIRFDNRDCGLSTKFDGVPVDLGAAMAAAIAGGPVADVPYTLSDMAADAVGLLDHLGIDSAHVLGASMGGMIAQTMAIEHPRRVRSLVSVMSSPGELDVGQATPEAAAALLLPPPLDRQSYVEQALTWQVWHSKKYRNAERTQTEAGRAFDRCFYPEGASRQLAAIYASGRRTAGLQSITTPTLVIHGRDDTLISPSGGMRTAELIDGAHLLLLADMGHDVPEELWPVVVSAITAHTTTADERATAAR
jgi:pimeloyl-ACP methyl ester carboxylesterase